MEIWLDSTSTKAIKRLEKLGFLHGITTNPSLIREVGKPIEKILENLLSEQSGPITVQVTAENASEMIRQGKTWYAISPRILIKVPVTQEGFKAMRALSRQGIPIMATTVFCPHQMLLAALAGASYVALYLTRMEKAGIDSIKTMSTMMNIIAQQKLNMKLLAASISSLEQITLCAELGIHAITLKEPIFEAFLQDNPLTMECLPM